MCLENPVTLPLFFTYALVNSMTCSRLIAAEASSSLSLCNYAQSRLVMSLINPEPRCRPQKLKDSLCFLWKFLCPVFSPTAKLRHHVCCRQTAAHTDKFKNIERKFKNYKSIHTLDTSLA